MKQTPIADASLGGPYTKIGNDAVKGATDLGITIVVAAGNNRTDAADYSPASALSTIIVGAINSSSHRTMWSNHGKVVHIFAPGSKILNAGHLSDSSSNTGQSVRAVYQLPNTIAQDRSGTSTAAPHVAGLAAYFMAKEGLWGSAAVTKCVIGPAGISGVYYAYDSHQRVTLMVVASNKWRGWRSG